MIYRIQGIGYTLAVGTIIALRVLRIVNTDKMIQLLGEQG